MTLFARKPNAKGTEKRLGLLGLLRRRLAIPSVTIATSDDRLFIGDLLRMTKLRKAKAKSITSAIRPPTLFDGNPDPFSRSMPLPKRIHPSPSALSSTKSDPLSILSFSSPAISVLSTVEAGIQSADKTSHLQSLPDHIIDDIAVRLDRKTLLRVMRTCRALREAAMKAYEPSCAFRGVTTTPPLFPAIFSRAKPKLAANDTYRWAYSRSLNRAVKTHYDIYPWTAPLLRRLKVEVRTDDRQCGWELIERFAPQLEHLSIHGLDELWHLPIEYDEDEDGRFAIYPYPDPIDNWTLSFFFNPLNLSFPNLTTLTIAATARTASWLSLFADGIPNLHTLTLTTFGRNDLDLDNVPAEFNDFACFPHLHTLTVSGDDEPMAILLHTIVVNSSHIRHLVLHNATGTWMSNTVRDIVDDILACQRLVGLALYGPLAAEIVSHLAIMTGDYEGREIPPMDTLSDLTDLVIEGIIGPPFISVVPECPEFNLPSLKRLTYVEQPKNPPGMIRMPTGEMEYDDRFNLEDPRDFIHDYTLSAIFEHYTTLERVQWARSYSLSPFADHPPSAWEKRGIDCCVYRPVGEELLRALSPPFTRNGGSE